MLHEITTADVLHCIQKLHYHSTSGTLHCKNCFISDLAFTDHNRQNVGLIHDFSASMSISGPEKSKDEFSWPHGNPGLLSHTHTLKMCFSKLKQSIIEKS